MYMYMYMYCMNYHTDHLVISGYMHVNVHVQIIRSVILCGPCAKLHIFTCTTENLLLFRVEFQVYVYTCTTHTTVDIANN